MACAGCERRRQKIRDFIAKYKRRRAEAVAAKELARAVEKTPMPGAVYPLSPGHQSFGAQMPDGRLVVIDPSTMEEK